MVPGFVGGHKVCARSELRCCLVRLMHASVVGNKFFLNYMVVYAGLSELFVMAWLDAAVFYPPSLSRRYCSGDLSVYPELGFCISTSCSFVVLAAVDLM